MSRSNYPPTYAPQYGPSFLMTFFYILDCPLANAADFLTRLTMDHTEVINRKQVDTTHALQRRVFRPAPCDNPVSTWAPFPRLPPQLRLDIWLHHLRQHRMIEVDIRPAAADDPDNCLL